MTISSQQGRQTYAGAGTTGPFPVPFKFFANSDIKVVKQSAAGVDVTLVETSDYTLTGAGNEAGGSLTTIANVAIGETLSVILDPQLKQSTDYVSNDAFAAESHERALDRLTQQSIRTRDIVLRALRQAEGDFAQIAPLPGPAARAGKFLFFDASTGDPEVVATLPLNQVLSQSVIGLFLYPLSTAESAFGLTNADLNHVYPYGHIYRYGTNTTPGTTDLTTAFARAVATNSEIYAPADTYAVDTIELNRDGLHFRTDGPKTIIQQRAGTGDTIVVIGVRNSHVKVDSLTIKGNISTDSGEFHHALQVYNGSGSIRNVRVGDIYAENIRGDGLYVGAPNGQTTKDVKAGMITGKNVLRNVVSVIGASDAEVVAAIVDTSCGYKALLVEPDDTSPETRDVRVGYVRGGFAGVVAQTSATTVRSVHIDEMDLDPGLQSNSTPNYGSYSASDALILRNVVGLKIGTLRLRNHTGLGINYVWNVGEQRGQAIEIGYLDVANVGSADVTYNAICQFGSVDSFRLHDGNVVHQAVGDSIVIGDSSGSTFTRAIIDRMICDGHVVRYVSHGRFSNILINTANATQAFLNCDDCTILDSSITIPTLLSFCNRITLVNVTASCSTAYLSNTNDVVRVNTSFGGNDAPFGTTRAPEAGQANELVLGFGTQTTVGPAGGASALPATPSGYQRFYLGGTQYVWPYYEQA